MNKEDFISKSILTKAFNARDAFNVSRKPLENDQLFTKHNIYNLNCYCEDVLRLTVECMLYQFEANKLSEISLQSILCNFTNLLDNMPEIEKATLPAFIKAMQNNTVYFNQKSSSCKTVKNHLYEYFDKMQSNGDILKKDIWRLEDLPIAKDRINQSMRRNVVDYRLITNNENRFLVKKYLYYIIFEANDSISTIFGKFHSLKTLLNLIEVPYPEWTKDDAIFAFETYSQDKIKKTVATRYQNLKAFSSFLVTENIIEDSPIKTLVELGRTGSHQYVATAPDDYVVNQIFHKLNRFNPEVSLWFLIIKCTGWRGSDVCQTPRKCLEFKHDKSGNPIYSLRTYSSKFKKDVVNVIPENLYNLIDAYIKENQLTNKYLFPSNKINSCVQRSTMVQRFKDSVKELNITNVDGTPYVFKPHSFRHLMAVKMRENDTPLQFIQEQLHHSSPEMTMAYMEYTQKQLLKDVNKFYNINGELSPVDLDLELTDDEKYAEYLSKYINARTLSNGVCSKSAKLGPCSHGNSCLDCPSFRTSLAYLPDLKDQLQKAEVFLVKAIENDWKPQIKTNEMDIRKLKNLIKKIECTEATLEDINYNNHLKLKTNKDKSNNEHRRNKT